MRKGLLPLALGLTLAAGPAAADVLVMPEGEPLPEIALPAKGTSMADVEKKYGEPRTRHPAVGGDKPEHPPITRWDYDAFSVIFEHDKVVDGVIPGAPPEIVNRAGLERVPVEYDTMPQEPATETAPAEPAAPAPETPAPNS